MNVKNWILSLSFLCLFLCGCKVNYPCIVKDYDYIPYDTGISVEKRNYYELTIVDSNGREKIIKSYVHYLVGDTIK